MTQKERLQQHKLSQNPLGSIFERVQMIKGENGYTPIKGKDYFTPQEVQDIISHVSQLVKEGKQGNSGKDGRDGRHGLNGKDGRDGVNGRDGIQGKDGKNGISPKLEVIVSELKKSPIKYKDIQDMPDEFADIPGLVKFLKAGGFRGGGSSGTGTVAIVYTETPTGLINGSNVTYTTAHIITNVYSFAINGQYLHPISDYTLSGVTITMVTALDASLSGKPFTIIYS